jgi:undecaprenyl-diphosphatase
MLVALTLSIGAAILWLADRLGRRDREAESLSFPAAFGVGCAQALALIPGISRSGISISAGLGLGLTREAAARFSFLMAAPIVAGAGVFEARKLVSGGGSSGDAHLGVLVVGFLSALVAGMFAIGILLRYVRTNSMTVFVVYRLVLAAIVVVVFFNA